MPARDKLTMLAAITYVLSASPDMGRYQDDELNHRPVRKPGHANLTQFCGDCINGKKEYCKFMNKSIAKTTPACKNYHYDPNSK